MVKSGKTSGKGLSEIGGKRFAIDLKKGLELYASSDENNFHLFSEWLGLFAYRMVSSSMR